MHLSCNLFHHTCNLFVTVLLPCTTYLHPICNLYAVMRNRFDSYLQPFCCICCKLFASYLRPICCHLQPICCIRANFFAAFCNVCAPILQPTNHLSRKFEAIYKVNISSHLSRRKNLPDFARDSTCLHFLKILNLIFLVLQTEHNTCHHQVL